MSNKKTVFNLEWSDEKLNPQWAEWIHAVPNNPYKARCRLCCKTFNLSNMGRQAIFSHEKSSKHQKALKNVNQCSKIEHFGTSVSTVCDNERKPIFISFSHKNAENANNGDDKFHTTVKFLNKGSASSNMTNYVIKESVLMSEILWAMKLVKTHSSYNSFKDAAPIFQEMFPDSDIAKNVSLGSTKMSYYVTFGLYPYFRNLLINEISTSYFVLCMDEALNTIAQKGQMDLIIRYWPENSAEVKVRFLNSVFLGHSTANDIYEKFCEGTADLNLKNLLQIAMDGPYVNLKFWRQLCDDLKENKGFSLLHVGTCSLHIIHGAFQKGNKVTGWNLNSLFHSMYKLFKDSPARRADFIAVTNSNVFPLKFCQIRWVENVSVAERALSVFLNVKKYFEAAKKDLPHTVMVGNIDDACRDKLILAKISFFISIASILQPFLKSFQSPSPMIPFLYSSLTDLLRQIMVKFIMPQLLKDATTAMKLMNIDISSIKNHKKSSDIDIGIAARSFMKKSGASDSEKNKFFSQCKDFLVNLTIKIFEKSPINFSIVRSMSCLDPHLLWSNPVLCEKRMDVLLQILHESNILSSLSADRAKCQFFTFTNKVKTEWKENFENFSLKESRLDTFYSNILSEKDEFMELWKVIKIVLTLCNGNASCESGFSINKDILVENLHEKSLVALRTTYDAIQSYGGILSVKITPEMMQSVRMSRNRYHLALEEKRKINETEKKAEAERKRRLDQIKILQQKRSRLATEMTIQSQKINEQIIELQKQV